LLDRVTRRGYHATFRESQAFIAYLLFRGKTCEGLIRSSHELSCSLPQLVYSGDGGLFSALEISFDPVKYSHPKWDELLVHAQTCDEDWLSEWGPETDALNSSNLIGFEARKRAFFFFHKNGDELLKMAYDDETEFAEFLDMPDREALRLLIRRVNNFFGDDSPDRLLVWQNHHYDQAPRKILYSATSRSRTDFELVKPKLSNIMGKGFDLSDNHRVIRLRARVEAQLKIDFQLFEMLANAERGVPIMSVNTQLTRRLWQFMEQLSDPLDQDEASITIFDPVTSDKITVAVDIISRQYLTVTEGRS
jgi:hypothetical protein